MDDIAQLYRTKYRDWVWYVACKTTPIDAEDIVNDVVLRVMELPTPPENLQGYVSACLDNAIVDWYRDRAKRREVSTPAGSGEPDISVLDHMTVLPPLEQMAVYLRHVLGYSRDEIGVELDLSLHAIKWLLEHGMAVLREEFDVKHAAYGSADVADRRQVVCELRDQGLTVSQVSQELGISQRTVYRDIAANRKQPPQE